MRWLRCVAVAALVGSTGCANVWGFAQLTSEEHDSGSDDSEANGDSSDSAADTDAGSGDDAAPCRLSSGTSCRGHCAADASPCGCLADPGSATSYCGATGIGVQGATCSRDTDCAPGYGCLPTTMQCSHWCPPATSCPNGTTCHLDATLVFGGQTYGFCY